MASDRESDGLDQGIMSFVDEVVDDHNTGDAITRAPTAPMGSRNIESAQRAVSISSAEEDEDSSSDGSVIEAAPERNTESATPAPTYSKSRAPVQELDVNYYEDVKSLPSPVQISVRVPTPKRPWEYRTFDDRLKKILQEGRRGGQRYYVVQRMDGKRIKLSAHELRQSPTGDKLLRAHSRSVSTADSSDDMRLRPRTRKNVNFVDLAQLGDSSDDDELLATSRAKPGGARYAQFEPDSPSEDDEDDVTDDHLPRRSRAIRSSRRDGARPTRQTRVSGKPKVSYNYGPLISDDDDESASRRKSTLGKRKRADRIEDPDVRRSGRQRESKTMRELGENEIDEVEMHKSAGPKATGAKEFFKKLDPQNEFRKRHCMTCDTCSIMGNDPERGQLIFCQSCTLSYHQQCLGHRTNREHLVTKVGDQDFVLQCRRCTEMPRRKDKTAPHHGRCSSCKKPGSASKSFRPRKTPSEEQKERDENEGEDPIYSVSSAMVNDAENVLFRCTKCFQAYHLHHLPSKQDNPLEGDDRSQKARHRFAEYSETWTCHECEDRPSFPHGPNKKAIPGTLIAWRPVSTANYTSGQTVDQVNEDDKEYLVKWQNMSHYKCMWKSGPWVYGVVPSSTRRAFAAKENNVPTMTTEDAIPEDWLCIDIIFSVKYNNFVQAKIEEVDIARIKEVGRVYVKFKGLGYEDAVWTDPPDQEETDRYEDFRAAYVDYVRGQYIRMPTQKRVSTEVQRLRPLDGKDSSFEAAFEKKILLKEQPRELSGGKLMDYQLDGVNWMLFQWLKERNAVLADEMGLGKTIQVVGFLTALKETHHMSPFLIVVPNATCANWRREIKQWAPGLRVVTYFGSAKAKELSMEYELFGDRSENPTRQMPGAQDLRCHVVVTSYDAAAEPDNQAFFRRMNWQALIVDEGQRLKNDKTNLYGSLLAIKAPFRLLLTGTPLQNNQRELFNLLHFLDKSFNADALEREYENLDEALVKKLHDMIRPYFLRRTKAQVLDFLPPMGQIIVPITMTKLQKELYKNILSKNAELVKAVLGKGNADKGKAMSGLKNVLMQLRKVLCHPFVYSIDVEERTRDAAVSHRRLVAASAKLVLLELILPKLKERGNRVLIFSQFLDNLTIVEDFLDGMQLPHLRLDGSQGSLQKQKVIDKFNAPNSECFCMLLSTRAGGVGINLATADTVIILDPDFNPHQDIQAISRAHRIGQQNKVLVFKLMTRDSAEERIMQVGKKKMVLDHVIIEQMDEGEADGNDLQSILAYGAKALFEDDTTDITYDDNSIEKLLDRSQIEDTKGVEGDDTQETQFSFARIWKNDAGAMGDQLPTENDAREGSADSALWDTILEHRQKEAEEEKRRKEAMLGRGRRARTTINYGQDHAHQKDDDSDTDFADKDGNESDAGSAMSGVEDNGEVLAEATQLNPAQPEPPVMPAQRLAAPARPSDQVPAPPTTKRAPKVKPVSGDRQFVRADPKPPRYLPNDPNRLPCLACKDKWGAHESGSCPLKIAGPELCNLCGLAHFGYQRTCPHLQSETQVRLMLEALKGSSEDAELVREARTKLQGIKGTIVQKKKKNKERLMQQQGGNAGSAIQLDGAAPAPLSDISANRQNGHHGDQYQGGVFTAGWSALPQNSHAGNGPPAFQIPAGVGTYGHGGPYVPHGGSSGQVPGGYMSWEHSISEANKGQNGR